MKGPKGLLHHMTSEISLHIAQVCCRTVWIYFFFSQVCKGFFKFWGFFFYTKLLLGTRLSRVIGGSSVAAPVLLYINILCDVCTVLMVKKIYEDFPAGVKQL